MHMEREPEQQPVQQELRYKPNLSTFVERRMEYGFQLFEGHSRWTE